MPHPCDWIAISTRAIAATANVCESLFGGWSAQGGFGQTLRVSEYRQADDHTTAIPLAAHPGLAMRLLTERSRAIDVTEMK